ncbi:MAG: hypothetical protein PHH75_01080 [Candidatus Omnitrophica bacterium]|nr:hypothetical protein [Candidatus Omnitrophota bacterium]MDD5573750.1 hypothetical protein [Candidatus Omnitrophota bacterium]
MDIFFFIRKHLFLILLFFLAVSFFARNNYRSVREIAPEALQDPVQTPLAASLPITFQANGYAYELEPLYRYEINAMLVHKLNYRTFSIYKFDRVFAFDLCMIWGDNLLKKAYQEGTLSFSQDCRFCWAQWRRPIFFNLNQLSNNHLLIKNKGLERMVGFLVYGDQVKIKGKLVNVRARKLSAGSDWDSPSTVSWKTSTCRTDAGAGACEVIFVEDIKILKAANVFWRSLFLLSLFGLLGLMVWRTVRFFAAAAHPPKME